MAVVIDNPAGRRMIRLSIDDILTIVSIYQQKCNCKALTYEETRKILKNSEIYLPEDFN
ncbi:MAG TPA: hypothetical protein P5556_09515 [Candidatus Gastranaerophilales bacterium]|nr:hypothetical protein [Candidatus Gastranaerophilales bacterium]